MNRTIHFLSTSRTALILLLATLLNAATPCTASRSPTNPSPTAAAVNNNKVYGLKGLKGQSKKSEKSVDKKNSKESRSKGVAPPEKLPNS